MIVAVTGLTGFLGYFLAKSLCLNENIKIKALVRESSNLNFLEDFREKISFVYGDLSNHQSLADLVNGADIVIHAAYYRESGLLFRGDIADKRSFLDINLLGSHSLLENAKNSSVKQFIFISSCAVFGYIDPDLPLDEKHPLRPDSIYGAYKASVESMCHAYFLSHGLESVIFRPVAIYGKHPNPEKQRWQTLINDIKDGKDVNVSSGGKIVHADEVVQAIMNALGNSSIAGNIYSLVDLFIDEIEIAETVKEITGSKSNISGTRKVQKNVMINNMAKKLGVNFRGRSGLRNYINDILGG